MKPVVYDITLSASIMDVTGKLLPFTAEGKTMPAGLANDLVIELAVILKLATSMEKELAVHRLGEPAAQVRAMLDAESAKILSLLGHQTDGKVVKVDFKGGPKK